MRPSWLAEFLMELIRFDVPESEEIRAKLVWRDEHNCVIKSEYANISGFSAGDRCIRVEMNEEETDGQ